MSLLIKLNNKKILKKRANKQPKKKKKKAITQVYYKGKFMPSKK